MAAKAVFIFRKLGAQKTPATIDCSSGWSPSEGAELPGEGARKPTGSERHFPNSRNTMKLTVALT